MKLIKHHHELRLGLLRVCITRCRLYALPCRWADPNIPDVDRLA